MQRLCLCLVIVLLGVSLLAGQERVARAAESRPAPCRILEQLGPAAAYEGRRWVDGVVPYVFGSNVTPANQLRMKQAMSTLESVANLSFVVRTTEKDYLAIQDSKSNASYVGRIGARQDLFIFNWGWRMIMVHELCHALGFHHEHGRPKRDDFIAIDWLNVINGQQNKQMQRQLRATPWGPYDFDSVMHYGQFDQAIDPKKPTILVKAPHQSWQNKIGQRQHLSAGDISGLQAVYGVSATTAVSRNSEHALSNGNSHNSDVSANGRYVTFYSSSDTLVPGDTNRALDVFVRDRHSGETTRVSVSSTGVQGNGDSAFDTWGSFISSDGRFVVFQSFASNLVPGDTNGRPDIFVRDRQDGKTTRVSVSSTGVQADNLSGSASISGDGRFVAFDSYATNLVSGDTNRSRDVFVHDRSTGRTSRVSVDSKGVEARGGSWSPCLSADGRFVAFVSYATNLVAADTNKFEDIFVHDRQGGSTTRVNVSSQGVEANSFGSRVPSISDDGRFVAFGSYASNLVAGDTNGAPDVFVRDRQTRSTTRVSVNSKGEQGNAGSYDPSVSADGRFVAFTSRATNLMEGVTNGVWHVYVRDRVMRRTSHASKSSSGVHANAPTFSPALSSDGRFVTFYSSADNLVPTDWNRTNDVFVHDRWGGYHPLLRYLPGGCAGSTGIPYLSARAWPMIGNDAFAIDVTNARPSSGVILLLAGSQASTNVGFGCTLHPSLSGVLLLTGLSDTSGDVSFPLGLPNLASLRGQVLNLQAIVLDSKGAWQSALAFTRGLRAQITN